MGKRGPTPKGEYSDKSAVLSTRITHELRSHLEAAVKRGGFTLSREIEHRLRRTFKEDEKVAEGFGTRRNYRLMQMVALCTQLAFEPSKPDFDLDWLSDPTRFEIARRMIMRLLEALRPAGPVPELSNFAELGIESQPARLLLELQAADSSLPLGVGAAQHASNLIKADLGDILFRSRIVAGNADDFRRAAEEMRAEANARAPTKHSKPRNKRKRK